MDSFDSRLLRYVDCYAQRFSAPGTVRYELTTLAGRALPLGEETFTIEVAEPARRKGAQHTVAVRHVDGAHRPEGERIEIEAGDIVLWNAREAATPGFIVRGESADGPFDSALLQGDAVYTHAFGSPGTYRWVDAYGSELGGEIVVGSLDWREPKSTARWQQALTRGAVVTIGDGSADPSRIEILTGQTVFWIIESTDGISITDARLLSRLPEDSRQAPAPAARRARRSQRSRKQ